MSDENTMVQRPFMPKTHGDGAIHACYDDGVYMSSSCARPSVSEGKATQNLGFQKENANELVRQG